MTCKRCGKTIPQSRQMYNAIFCSKYCRQQDKRERYQASLGDRLANKIQRGAAAELLVASNLLHRGYDVYRALNPDSKADLIAIKNNSIFRIQVRTVQMNNNSGKPYQNKRNQVDIHCDILALVIDQNIIYMPEDRI